MHPMISQPSTAQFCGKLAIYITLMALLVVAIILTPWTVKLLPIALLGALFAHGVELEHELIHQRHFPAPLQLVVGSLLGLPMLVEFTRYTTTHCYHHRMVGTPDDEESFAYDFDRLHSPLTFLYHLSLIDHYYQAGKTMGLALLEDRTALRRGIGKVGALMPEPVLTRMIAGYGGFAFVLTVAIGLSISLQTTLFLQLWLLPLVFANPIHALVELPEHWGCTANTTNCYENTRTIIPSPLLNWFTNGNCWHVEHHSNPAIPIPQLAAYHQQIAPQIRFLNRGYWEFYRGFFHTMAQQQASRVSASMVEVPSHSNKEPW